ncbi:unnamed protein product [Bursaphelenchus xylophilus]|uniref:(pine wood nematode) hypothetical protein n=1 Tax=Bursaphelenchus xylophilus TaxID=6326 RepID=A0A1I7S031_BURXY|nr:unnamed protein product [Bursaphelenchus xylophilus]CAG9109054.1 unnamed protein product [Bursaphelenchus xylophilus]
MVWLLSFSFYSLLRICVDGQEAVTVKHTDYFLNQPVDGDFSIIDEYHKQVAHLPPNQFADQSLLTFPSQNLLDLQSPTQGLLNVPMHNLLNMQAPLHTYAYFSEPGAPSLNSYPGLAYYLGQYGQEKEPAPSPHLEAKLRSYQLMKPLPVADDEDVKPSIPPVKHPRRRIYQTQEKVNTITLPQSSYQVRTPTNMKLEGSYGEPIRPIVSVGGRPTIHDPNDSIQIQTGMARVMIGRKPTTTPPSIDRMSPKTDGKDPFGMTDEEYQEFIPTIAVEPASEENEEPENLAEDEGTTKLPSLLESLSTASVFTESPIGNTGKERQAELTAKTSRSSSVSAVSSTSATVSSSLVSSTTISTTSHPTSTRSPGLEKIENIREILTVTDEYEVIDKKQSEVNNRRTTVTERAKPTAPVIEITSQSTAVISTVTSATATAASKKPTQKKIRKAPTLLPSTLAASSTSSSTTFSAKNTTPKTTSKTIVATAPAGKTNKGPATTTTTPSNKRFSTESNESSFAPSNEIPEEETDNVEVNMQVRTTVTETRGTTTPATTTAGIKTTPGSNAETAKKSKTDVSRRETPEVVTAPTKTVNGSELMMDITVTASRLSTPTTITTKIIESTTVPPETSSSKPKIATTTAKTDTSPTYKSYKMERLSIWEILEHKKNDQTELSQDDTDEEVLQRLDDLNSTDETTAIDHKLKRFQTMAPNVLFGL